MFKKVIYFIIAVIVLFFPSFTSAATNEFMADRIQILFNETNGLVSSEANDVLQTSDGYIWIGSYAGLIRYDAKSFTYITQQTHKEFTASSIRNLYESKDKTMYVASNDKGLFSYKNGEFKHIKNASDSLSDSVRVVSEDRNGEIYVGTSGGLGKIKDGKIYKMEDKSVIDNSFISISFDEQNRLWGVTQNGNLLVLEEDKVIAEFNQAQLENNIPTFVFCNKSNEIFIGTYSNKVLLLDESSTMEKLEYKVLDISDLLYVCNVYEDSQGQIWVLAENGAGYFSKDMKFNKCDGMLANNFMETMIEDFEGNYWFSSSKQGILYVGKSRFTNIFFKNNIEKQHVNVTCEWKDQLYVGMDTGLVIIKDGKQVDNELTNMLKDIRVRHLYVDSKDNLWISTYATYGLMRVSRTGEIKNWLVKDGLPTIKVRSVLESMDGNIYVGTNDGISVIKENEIVKTYNEKSGFKNTSILCMSEQEDGSIYIGTDGNGIYVIKDDKITNYDETIGFSAGVILRMKYDPENEVTFVCTGSNQLDVWKKDGTVFQIPDFYAQGGNFDLKFFGDKLLILSAKGLYIGNRKEVAEGINKLEFFGSKDGLPLGISSNSWNALSEEGILSICSNDGVYDIDISNIYKNKTPPKLGVSAIEVDGILYTRNLEDGMTLPADAKRITIHFSVLSFLNTANNIATYQFRGFDDEPIAKKISELESVTYTNLKGGEQTFVLSGQNADGIHTEEDTILTITKELSIKEKPFIYILGFILLSSIFCIIFWIYFRIKTKGMLAKQQTHMVAMLKEEIKISNALRTEAETATKTKSDFLANMSHEIRTPMNAITGMSELVLRNQISDEVRSYMLSIKAASKSLLTTINDILDFSKIEAGKLEIIPVKYQVSSLLSDMAMLASVRIGEKPIHFTVEVDKNLPYKLCGDENRLRQILTNFINNAIKFTQEGQIILRISGIEEEDNADSLLLKMEIIDTGMGIRADDIQKLFSSFSQVDTKKNRSMEGTGLGLAICKNLSELMGGTVSVVSVYGKGSTFSAIIPQKIVERTPIGEFRVGENITMDKLFEVPFTAKKAKILVVDDNKVNRLVAEGLLLPYQMHIKMASSGAECLELLKTEVFDIVFMDHMMPIMDGVEATKQIREKDKKTIIVALTANAISGVREQYLKDGFSDYLSKPIDVKKMNEILLQYIPQEYIVPIEQNNRTANRNESRLSREILRSIYVEGKQKIPLLKKLYEEKDIKRYGIEVHALKSVALIGNQMELSEMAKQQELAAKDHKISVIEEGFDKLISQYESYINSLEWVVEEHIEVEKIVLKQEEVQQLFATINVSAQEFDFDGISEGLEKLKKAVLSKSEQDCLDNLIEAAELIDYDRIVKILES